MYGHYNIYLQSILRLLHIIVVGFEQMTALCLQLDIKISAQRNMAVS